MLSVRISTYGCTREVWRAREKRKSCSKRTRTLASWVLSKRPKCIHNTIYAQLKAWANSFTILIIHLKKLLGSDWLKRSAFLVNTVQKRVTQCRKVKHECKLQRRYPKLKRRLLEANRCISKTAVDRAKPSEDRTKSSEEHTKPSEDFRKSPENVRMFSKITRILPKFFRRLFEHVRTFPKITRIFPKIVWTLPKTYDNLRRSTKITGYFRTFSKF